MHRARCVRSRALLCRLDVSKWIFPCLFCVVVDVEFGVAPTTCACCHFGYYGVAALAFKALPSLTQILCLTEGYSSITAVVSSFEKIEV